MQIDAQTRLARFSFVRAYFWSFSGNFISAVLLLSQTVYLFSVISPSVTKGSGDSSASKNAMLHILVYTQPRKHIFHLKPLGYREDEYSVVKINDRLKAKHLVAPLCVLLLIAVVNSYSIVVI